MPIWKIKRYPSFTPKAVCLSQWQLTKRWRQGKDFAPKEESGRVFLSCRENKATAKPPVIQRGRKDGSTEAQHYRHQCEQTGGQAATLTLWRSAAYSEFLHKIFWLLIMPSTWQVSVFTFTNVPESAGKQTARCHRQTFRDLFLKKATVTSLLKSLSRD